MSNFQEISAITVTSWNTEKLDKHDKSPVLLKCLAGKMPNKAVISGTIAERSNFELNKSYLVQITETETNEYGRNFQFTNLGLLSALDILQVKKELGAATILEVTTEKKAISQMADTKTA